MLNGTFWLAIIILVPFIGTFLISANAAPIFLSLCLGYVLYSFDTHNAHSLLASIHSSAITHLKPTDIIVNLVLLIGPAVVTLISQIHSVKGSNRFLNLIPAAFCGLFIALLVVPTLPGSVMNSIIKTAYWGKLIHYQAMIVGVGAAVALFFFWFNSKHAESKKTSKAKS